MTHIHDNHSFVQPRTMPSLFAAALRQAQDKPAIHYFDQNLSYAELDTLSDRLAHYLQQKGLQKGDRVALYMQNIPQFVICCLALWKCGAIGVTVNPMNQKREVLLLLKDSGAQWIVMQTDLYQRVGHALAESLDAPLNILLTDTRDFQSRNDSRVQPTPITTPTDGHPDLQTIINAPTPTSLHPISVQPDDIAMLVYTSGTTGAPKGAMVTHANLAIDAALWRRWVGFQDGEPIMGLAPLFHITGLSGHLAYAFAAGSPLILTLRFHPDVFIEAALEHKPAFVVGAITAYVAIMNTPNATPQHLASITHAYTGGAPVPAALAAQFEKKFDLPLRNCYGLTESTALAVGVPPDAVTPTDENGAFSVGVPVFETEAYIANDDGQSLPTGEIGEILLKGPQMVPGYWQQPEETKKAYINEYFRTGDMGYMDANGWIFLIDRKKDMINASGFKVWPKEVEDVIYEIPGIREVAVVGVPDDYRGETVKAVVSLQQHASITAEELVAFCRERLSAYKCPHQVEIMEDLPKTVTGKILRRSLRT